MVFTFDPILDNYPILQLFLARGQKVIPPLRYLKIPPGGDCPTELGKVVFCNAPVRFKIERSIVPENRWIAGKNRNIDSLVPVFTAERVRD
jgi:hypothetical protein